MTWLPPGFGKTLCVDQKGIVRAVWGCVAASAAGDEAEIDCACALNTAPATSPRPRTVACKIFVIRFPRLETFKSEAKLTMEADAYKWFFCIANMNIVHNAADRRETMGRNFKVKLWDALGACCAVAAIWPLRSNRLGTSQVGRSCDRFNV